MPGCCVPNCRETGGHRFPRDDKLIKMWLKAIKRVKFEPKSGARVCHKHFKESDYEKIGKYSGLVNQRKILKKSAIPSVFPWNEEPTSILAEDPLKICNYTKSWFQAEEATTETGSNIQTLEELGDAPPPGRGRLSRRRKSRLDVRGDMRANGVTTRDAENRAKLRRRCRKADPGPERFPTNEERQQLWLEAIGEENLRPNIKGIFLCSEHFHESEFNRTLETRRLRDDAVPSVFETPEALKQSKKQETTKMVKKKMLPINILRKVKPSVAPKEDKVPEAAESPPKVAGKSPSGSKRPEFECPVCSERFPVYFTTFRHIQKKHCVNEKGDKVSTNSPDLVKPIRIETCASCSQQIRSTEPHKCPQQQSNKDKFCCLGCRQVFTGLVVFQHHVKGLHADGAQNYFFPTRDDFLNWKEDLEEQTMVKFVKLNKTKSKEIYHCSHQVVGQTSATDTCCSLITVREYTKGFHICYYKEHKGHKVDTSPLTQHSKYCISLYTQDKEEIKLEAEEDNELFMQFKKMISCILFDAANVSSNTLKELLGKALEMTSVLKHAEGQDRSTPLISKCLSDAQISKTLDSLKADPNKRKFPDDSNTKTVTKRARKSPHSADKVVENGMATRHKNSLTVNKSVSFTDLQGSDDIENIVKEVSATPEKSATKQKSVPKKAEVTVTVEPKEEETTNKSDDVPIAALRSQLQSPSSFNESYKNFVDQNFKVNTENVSSTPKTRANVKKKEVVKTKIGQFKIKPSVSPKTVSPKSPKEVIKEVPTTPRIRKPVADIQYEVKEQENDCNILILKI